MTGTTSRRRPRRWLLPLYRLPAWVFRMRLGWLFLGRFLLIVHQGRRTGKRRYVVVEVVRHDHDRDEYVVVSGYGTDSDWYRNIRRAPALEVAVGRRRFIPQQRFLPEDEAYDEFLSYERRHPWAARTIPHHLGVDYDGSDEGRKRLVQHLPMIGFRPARA